MGQRKSVLSVAVALAVCVLSGTRAVAADEFADGDAKLLREQHVATDGDSLLTFFRQRSLNEENKQKVQKLIEQLGNDSFEVREQASQKLATWGTAVVPLLKAAVKDNDAERGRRARLALAEIEQGPGNELPAAAARQLARQKTAGAVAVLLNYLPYADDEMVEEEVLGALVSLAGSADKIEPAILRALNDTVPSQRAAAAYILGRFSDKDKDRRAAVRKRLTDDDVRVRWRAAQGLIASLDKEAVPAVVDLLTGPEEMAWRAEELLLRMAGEEAPTISAGDGSKQARQKQRDAWADWWRDHAAKTDLARLQMEKPYLGLTVIAQMSAGRVWECGKDGKPRWSITGLQGPIDAQVLPGNHVLIAEFQGLKITERDLDGKVVWEKKVPSSPVNVQRLPNGNTFIVTYQGVMEVGRDGKEIYSHHIGQGRGGNIYSGQKLRNGHALAMTINGMIIEIDPTNGKTVKTVNINSQGSYSVELLSNGHYLVAHYNQGKVVEYDGDGKSVWECTVPNAYDASRLPNGHTLISSHSRGRIVEVDREGKTVWEQTTEGPVWRVRRR